MYKFGLALHIHIKLERWAYSFILLKLVSLMVPGLVKGMVLGIM